MSKICTDLEQSRKLVELGIEPNTADMLWGYYYNGENHCVPNIRPFRDARNEIPNGYSPAWSLSALLELMPKIRVAAPIIVKALLEEKYYCHY